MRINRLKRAQANLAFYRNNFHFRAPYHILVDGTFCVVVVKRKQDFKQQLKKYMDDDVVLFTTACVIREMEKLGDTVQEAVKLAKDFKIKKCDHMEKPVSAARCLHSIIKGKSENEHFFVATQDRQLVEKLKKRPGCPLIYIKLNAILLDRPSAASQAWVKQNTKEQLIGKEELERLKNLKAEIASNDPNQMKKKRKMPKGPHPMSCLKKKTKPKESMDNKKKRKRSRQKVAKHIRNLLDQNEVDV